MKATHRLSAFCNEDIHGWFNLTYANYLTLPRTLLQSMPREWQHRFVTCLEELDAAFRHVEYADMYRVQAVDEGGRFAHDPIPHYERGRTRIPPFGESPSRER